MQIPPSYADAVIGTSGSNISYMHRASGASITIQEMHKGDIMVFILFTFYYEFLFVYLHYDIALFMYSLIILYYYTLLSKYH